MLKENYDKKTLTKSSIDEGLIMVSYSKSRNMMGFNQPIELGYSESTDTWSSAFAVYVYPTRVEREGYGIVDYNSNGLVNKSKGDVDKGVLKSHADYTPQLITSEDVTGNGYEPNVIYFFSARTQEDLPPRLRNNSKGLDDIVAIDRDLSTRLNTDILIPEYKVDLKISSSNSEDKEIAFPKLRDMEIKYGDLLREILDTGQVSKPGQNKSSVMYTGG